MKKVYIYSISLLLLITGIVGAQSLTNSLDTQLIELGVIPSNISSLERVSRYEYSRLLSTLDCTQCSPAETTFKSDIESRVDTLDPFENNLDDFDLGNMMYNDEDLSYCVAHVAKNQWMTGFPRSTSPLCPGEFCGGNTLVFGDLVQSLFMYTAPYKLQDISIPRTNIGNWIDSLGNEIDIPTRIATSQALKRCGNDPCTADTFEELDIYARYCQYHLDECNMRSTNTLEENKYPLGHLNLLDTRGVIDMSADKIDGFGRYDPVPGDVLMDIYLPLIEQAKCPIITDFDEDGIRNSQDSCPYTYNPHQHDTDQDGIGDVCDDDIDGDGIKNELGAVDDLGNIIREKWGNHDDNCLWTINPGQEDTNTDKRGDACDDLKIYTPLKIEVEPLSSIIGEETTATAKTIHEYIDRQRGDAGVSTGASSTHIYTTPGTYTIIGRAYDRITGYDIRKLITTDCPHIANETCIISVAKATITVEKTGELKAALQGNINPKKVAVGEEVSLSHIYEGNIDYVQRTITDILIEVEPGETTKTSFEKTGLYTVIVEGYTSDNKRVGLSQFTVEVTDSNSAGRVAEIVPNKLVFTVGEIMTVDTIYAGFDPIDVKNVMWSLGGDLTKETKELQTQMRLTKPGHILVEQIISFEDSYPDMVQRVTIYVEETEKEPFESSLEALPTTIYVGESVQATITTNLSESIKKIDCARGDGSKNQNVDLVKNHIYTSSGVKTIRCTIITDQDTLYIHDQTILVLDDDLCDTNIRGEERVGDEACDMDEDGIPDICDSDIDGDGFNNLIGIIIKDNPDCSLSEENIDKERLEEQTGICKKGNDIGDQPGDNCFFQENSQQSDQDSDGIGDSCDSDNETPNDDTGDNDNDNDGFPDNEDDCPSIPGSLGGCPDLTAGSATAGSATATAGNASANAGNATAGNASASATAGNASANAGNATAGSTGGNNDDGPEENPLHVDTCTECPCPFIDYASEILPGDRIRAVLTDPGGERVYSISDPRIIRE